MGAAKTTTPRASANLTVGFGMVNVPIALSPLADTGRPVSGKYVCPQHGPNLSQRYLCSEGTKQEHLLAQKEQVTAYEHPDKPGEFVVVDPAVLAEIADERSGRIELEMFVPISSVDSVYFGDKTYLCWPQKGGEEAFDVLATGLRDQERAAVATVVLTKQTVTLVIRWSPATETLVAHVCRFHEQVRWANVEMVREAANSRKEPPAIYIETAKALMAALDGEFTPGEFVDRYTPLLQEAIRAAASGTTFTAPEPSEESKPTADLLGALMASVEEQKTAKKAPAKAASKSRAKAKA